MNKFKTFVKENKSLVVGIVALTAAAALATIAIVAVAGAFEDDSIVITEHPDGSFTVSAAPSE